MPKICIIIPFFNEQNRIETEGFLNFIQNQIDYSLMLVDDGSSDHTLDVLTSMKEQFPKQIDVFSLPKNVGKAEAVRQGVLKARSDGDFDFFGFMDGDLATPLEEAIRFIDYFNNYKIQFVSGSRVKLFGWDIQRSLKRHYFGRVFATYVSNQFNLEIYDTQCGAKFFTNCMAQDLFKEPFISKWFFDIELFIRLRNRMGKHFIESMIEIPLLHWHEIGESKLGLKDFLKTPIELRKIKRHYKI